MVEELVDICDDKNNLTSVKKAKSEAHRLGLWHRSAHIWIYNSRGEILIQLRAKDKLLHPNLWDISVAGHVSAGEDPLVSGIREISEEIGLKVKKSDLKFWKIMKNKSAYKQIKNNEFYYVYLLKSDVDITKLKLQKEEVQKIKLVSIKELETELKNNSGRFVPHGNYWFDIIKEIKKQLKIAK